MAHHTYTTPAFVLHGIDVGEGSRSLLLYTRELGLVYGLARSVREARSKLRFGLQPFTLAEVSLVRGRNVWRVTGAREILSYQYALRDHQEKALVVVRVMAFMRRLIRGETPEQYAFELLEKGFSFLIEHDLTSEEIGAVECLLIFRLLHTLGHVPPYERDERVGHDLFTKHLAADLIPHKRELILAINKGLAAAQL